MTNKERLAELRKHYSPYQRSLPGPFDVRRRQDLSGVWRWKFETEDFTGDVRPPAPDWHRPDLDVSGWQETTVPEWRYDKGEPFGSIPDQKAPRPDNKILWYRTSFETDMLPENSRAFLFFAGAAWEAEVWLNGVFLGGHIAYWEPFRFDVTSALKKKNVLAVRLLSGSKLGEPLEGWANYGGWSVLPFALAEQPRHVRDRSKSVVGQRELFGFRGSCFGSGIGLHREVLLETTGAAVISEMLVRHDAATGEARIQVETDPSEDMELQFEIQIMPENFDGGANFGRKETIQLRRGSGNHTALVAMPGSRLWQPDDPCLYRCRAIIRSGEGIIDSKDVLFGCRSFRLVTARHPVPGLPEGMFLLNGQPVFLRGAVTSSALNAMWYWRQEEELVDTVLMAKAAGFNAFRAGEYVQFAEVREILDRLGMMSEQDVVAVPLEVPLPSGPLKVMAALCVRLARLCYNNPGVVLLTIGGTEIERNYDPHDIVAAVLAVDPERVVKPITGHMADWGSAYECPPPDFPTLTGQQWENVVNDFHNYNGWYRRDVPITRLAKTYPPGRLVTIGEFGAEALDDYAVMLRYPERMRPPPQDADVLWGHSQVKKDSPKMLIGFRGKKPRCLSEYIEASQNYQADALAEQATGFRLSPKRIAGHFLFHFTDGLPAEWPKSIVSFDRTPKKAYFAIAQIYQPVAPLFRIADGGRILELWVANDRSETLARCRLEWSIEACGKTVMRGHETLDVLPVDATASATVDLPQTLPDTVTVSLLLIDAEGKPVARHRRETYLAAWRTQAPAVEPPRSADVPRLPDADGDPDRIDWNRAAKLGGWKQVEGGPAEHKAEARVAHDGHHLYVKLTLVTDTAMLRSETDIWLGEGWEVFLGGGPGRPYRQVGLNTSGAFLELTSDPALPVCGPGIVSRMETQSWTALMSFPLAALLKDGAGPGETVWGNFYCKAGSGDYHREMLAWSPNYTVGFHHPERFGRLKLMDL